MKYLLIFLLSIQMSFAQQMVILDKGQEAPFKGVLNDAKQMKVFRQANEEKKLLDKKVQSLELLKVKQEEIIKIHSEEAKHARTQYRREQVSNVWGRVVWFSLGILVTGVAFKIANEVD